MPFESKAQQRFMFAKHPEIAKRWASETSKKQFEKMPEKKKKDRVSHIVSKVKEKYAK